jgi:hypothetical protein
MSESTRTPLVRRLLDGGRSWGALDISASRCGIARSHLALFPPGISRDERIVLRLWRTWPIWGAVTWLGLQIVLLAAIGSLPALVVSTSICLGAGAVLMVMAGPARGGVRTLTVLRVAGIDDPSAKDAFAQLSTLAVALGEADARLASGELSAVEHEAAVWCVYDAMPAQQAKSVAKLRPGSPFHGRR